MMLRALAAKWGGLGASGSLRDGAAKPSRSSSDARANAPMPYAERASRSRRERAFIVFIVFIGRRFRRVRSADQFALAQPNNCRHGQPYTSRIATAVVNPAAAKARMDQRQTGSLLSGIDGRALRSGSISGPR